MYPAYKKESKSAGSFREAFRDNCSGGEGGTFSWKGRSYSCAKKKSAPKKYKGQGPSKSMMGKKDKVKKGSNPGSYSFRGGRPGRNV